ncbi:hypothetical protein [Mangrovibacillus cuniculi]|uniref:GerMN domain-containing protein n=1 Tax=Mangrovibacillus cuniculi TaxID=2593652 RepID=A0A7S8CB53_9BACI|nr:hypothetical protein [Mangrovibacillus cuniculi]QPC46734.1 hypothetical protein G8O30_07035 [Mangrovibacillus cuniculi]
MSKRNWDDEQLESLFKQMPSFKDKRSFQEVMRDSQSPDIERDHTKKILAPFVALAAVMVLSILSASFLMQRDSSEQLALQERSGSEEKEQVESGLDNSDQVSMFNASEETKETADEDSANKFEDTTEGEATQKEYTIETANYTSLNGVYETVENAVYIPIIVETKDATFLPLTVEWQTEAPMNEVVQEIVLEDGIKDETLNLADFLPLKATLSFNDEVKRLTVVLDENHPYNTTGLESAFIDLINTSYEFLGPVTVDIQTNDGKRASFSHLGEIKPFELNSENQPTLYYSYPVAVAELPYAFNGIPTDKDNLQEAIEELKISPSSFDQATVPENVEVLVEENGEQASVTLTNEWDSVIPPIVTIESILHTANTFGFTSVKFNNFPTENISLDLSKPIEAKGHVNVYRYDQWKEE